MRTCVKWGFRFILILLLAGVPELPATAGQGEESLKPEGGLQKKIDRLIGQLASDDFGVREEAEKKLREIGEPAREELKKALEAEDDEVRWRAARILRELDRKKETRESPRAETAPEREARPRVRRPRGLPLPPSGLDEGLDETIEELLKKMEEEFGMPDFDEFFRNRGRIFPRRSTPRLRPSNPERGRIESHVFRLDINGSTTVSLGDLGIEIQSLSDVLRSQLEIKSGGAAISGLKKDSPLYALGLRKHDIVLEVDGHRVGSVNDLAGFFRSIEGKGEISVRIMRKGKALTIAGAMDEDGKGLEPGPGRAEQEEKLAPHGQRERKSGHNLKPEEKPRKKPKRRYF